MYSLFFQFAGEFSSCSLVKMKYSEEWDPIDYLSTLPPLPWVLYTSYIPKVYLSFTYYKSQNRRVRCVGRFFGRGKLAWFVRSSFGKLDSSDPTPLLLCLRTWGAGFEHDFLGQYESKGKVRVEVVVWAVSLLAPPNRNRPKDPLFNLNGELRSS